ncbi:MAG: response regulator transcription factor [Verrucomicrobiaceae bacterium]|nr:response regulator transcription factor [Verrucomicrobiaceae bacterium]
MKILVAEDDANTRAALKEVLETEGFTVTAATNGTEAVDLFRREKPDFICLDVMMPGMNGYEVCRHVRKLDESVPILFLTAKAEEIDTVLGLELGADDYMTKPFGIKEVLARIRAILRRTAPLRNTSASQTFQMDDLRIFAGELRACRGEQEMPLTIRDVKILRLLYDRRGKVVDRNTLADEVWGADYFPESRALDQHISQLRKRIEIDPSNPRIIRTVHGAGYRYEG